jgi:acyl carrier protein
VCIRDAVRRFIVRQLIVDQSLVGFDDGDDLEERGIVDSFATADLVCFIEETFDVRVETSDVASGGLRSLAAIEKMVAAKRGGQ